ncbi:MAG: biliverdin-producing heme oxygenase [Candidatus Binatia bacterium]
MQPHNMILEGLRKQTKPYHDKLETGLGLFNRPLNMEDYCLLLKQMYGLYAPFEELLYRVALSEKVDFDFRARRKIPLLMQDLLACGLTISELDAVPVCSDLPPFAYGSHVFGCAYVMEGATLGGQVILKTLGPSLGITATRKGSFFNSYGSQVGAQWRLFCQALVSYTDSTERYKELTYAACTTFLTFCQWLTPPGGEL